MKVNNNDFFQKQKNKQFKGIKSKKRKQIIINLKNNFTYLDIKTSNEVIYISKYNTFISLIIFFIYMIFPILLTNEIKIRIRRLNLDSEITITIKGKGNQSIISDNKLYISGSSYKFDKIPNEIFVNGISINYTGKFISNLTNDENNITMKWNDPITDCSVMFNRLSNITYIDFSKFDSSKVTDMKGMFYDCNSLTSINFYNFNTSSVVNMLSMFYGCRSLEYLDLNHFDTSSVTNMEKMFHFCKSLRSLYIDNFKTKNVTKMGNMFNECRSLLLLNLTSFDTSSVIEMNDMFYNCKSLKFLNLKNFNTSSVTIMKNIFSGCNSLISLNLTNFNTSKVKQLDNMFTDCFSLISLNLKNFDTSSISNNISIFNGCNKTLKYCINEEKASKIMIGLSFFNNSDCLDNCFIYSPSQLIIEKRECVEFCSNDDIYKLEYDNVCYQSFSNDTYVNEDDLYYDKKDIEYYINEYLTSNKISNITTYYYEIHNSEEEFKKRNKSLTFIYFQLDSINNITNFFNLDKNKDKIFVLIIDSIINDLNIATSNYDYKLILENGTFLNLGNLKEDIYIDIYLHIIDLNLSNFEYYNYFYKQGYDIYDKKSNFYNDVCSPAHLDKNDIIIEDRKKDIYPNNVTLCKDNCEYKSINIEEQRIICECSLNLYSYYSNNNNISKIEDEENFITYLLDNINYKIFECYKLLKDFNNIKQSYTFYALLFFFFVIILNNIVVLIYSFSNIRKIMYKHFPSKKENHIDKINSHKNTKIKRTQNKQNTTAKNININISSISNDKIIISSYLEMNESKKELNKKEDFDELPFTQAIVKDKRSFFQIFSSLILKKIELIDLILGQHEIKAILFFHYILSLLIDFFFNTLLYSDEVVSNKYHNNGKLDFIVCLSLSLISNIVTSIISYYLKNWCNLCGYFADHK